MYLRFPGGNSGLSVCSVLVSDSERERACEHVSKSVSMQRVEQLNSVLNFPALRRGQLSPDLRHKVGQSLASSFNLVLFFPLFWMFASKDIMLRSPSGFWTFS